MAGEQQIVAYGIAGQVLVCPHADTAVPAAVTATILDSSGTQIETGAATRGALSTTTTAALTAGATTIPVSSSTGCSAGDRFVVTDAAGHRETCVAVGVVSGSITVRDRLARSYSSGATVKSAQITYTIDCSVVASYPKGAYYQAVWTSASWTSPRASLFRVVDLAVDASPIRFDDIRRWIPHVSALADGYDEPGLSDARETAWEIISARIEASGRDPAVYRSADRIRACGGLLAAALFAASHGHESLAERLAGDPLGEGGVFGGLWSSTEKLLGWFDADQGRSVGDSEVRSTATCRVRRGL